MSRIIWLLLLFGFSSWYPAQHKDTLQSWISGFSQLVRPVYSEDGRWVAIRRRYDLSQDTLLVVDTRKHDVPAGIIALGGETTFIQGGGILVFGNGKAEFRNLETNIAKRYKNVKIASPLSATGRYAVLDQEAGLTVYTADNKRLQYIKGVQGLTVTDRQAKLYARSQTGDHDYKIVDLSGNEAVTLRTTANPIKKMELSASGKYLMVQEAEERSNNSRLIMINTLNGKAETLHGMDIQKDDYYRITEIQQGKALLVSLHSPERPEKKIVDIWYGNDENLKTRKTGITKNRYWLWKPEKKKVVELPTDTYPVISAVNSERFFLAFNPTKGHNYLTYEPQLRDVQLYDAELNNYRPLEDLKGVQYGSAEIICSPDGKFLLGSRDGKKWSLFELRTMTKNVIDSPFLQNPVFTVDGKYIFFESPDDLWRYEIKTKKLKALHIAPGKAVKIMNNSISKMAEKWNFSVNTVDLSKPLLIQVVDQSESIMSYFIWKQGKSKEIVPPTKNFVRNIVHDDGFTSFCFLEENYNMAPELFLIKNGRQKKPLIPAETKTDKGTMELKQDIIHYTSTDGIPLKGVLYYPVNFNTKKKYPMVVHIYQLQNRISNQYLTPGYHNRDELDIRTLLEKGYFVLLPDTLPGASGAGLSALHCVNKALDLVSSNSSIDMHKVGLIGHSYGGYETNFIATHSNRFAAYISGAGLSDIIRSYFSYNYHFAGPYYWQFETGILQMKSFTEDQSVYLKNNPILHVDKVNAPILLWTGMQDENVPWDQTMEFFIGLRRFNKQVVTLFYSNGRHALGAGSEEKKDLHLRVLQWWDYFLKDQQTIPWIGNK